MQFDDKSRHVAKFGFSIWENIRKSFCKTFCEPEDVMKMQYIDYFKCAIKCPEWFMEQTTSQSTSSTPTTATPLGITTKSAKRKRPSTIEELILINYLLFVITRYFWQYLKYKLI